ncbi:MAG: ATP-binding protein [Eubacterium sp.]|nr:ATP-binding protein [Eubacterium sp.]
MQKYDRELQNTPFRDYDEYMQYIFNCVNTALDQYIEGMKVTYANEQGGYKSILYPDIEIAGDTCRNQIERFYSDEETDEEPADQEEDGEGEKEESMDEELMALLGAFSVEREEPKQKKSAAKEENGQLSLRDKLDFIEKRAAVTVESGISLPFYVLTNKLKFEPFTLFCFACGILSSTQTDYASVFQIVNENAGLSSPTIESAAKVFYGKSYSITGAYGDMSTCLEQLLPILSLDVMKSMPFSTVVSPDKRIIDCLFGRNPEKLDEDYSRFIYMLTNKDELDPILANQGILDEMKISYGEGVKIFYYYGDEGSGRRFFVKHFCRENGLKAVAINCKKLFGYDYQFVDKALWAVTRECILTNSCCCLTELSFREEEKERFFGYMDLAFSKLNEENILVFSMSKEHIDFREITKNEFTELELPTPNTDERQKCWEYYKQNYTLSAEIDTLEMATKFLFTPGKIHDALKNGRALSVMAQEPEISRDKLFKGCYNQMSSELSQKATKVKANFGFEDIVMNANQRETLEHAIDQMNYRKQVYENWNYTKKYPYGRGLSVLLYGAPGTGKSMCAQVIAHELNLELYRVDLSKVIDKYVGETEKSISMIFREAKKCNVVLFFDECDTLFAKRSDDGGSNQSSNNNKTALLLQEVEAYDGVSVLATNYKHNIDPAFFRRMKYIVEFQFPDPDTREMLWRTTIPKDTPLADDVDIRFLAEKFEFVGGNIKNCILNAAFLSAADPDSGGQVHMRHYLNAVKYEFVKVGKVYTKSDFEPYAEEVGLA